MNNMNRGMYGSRNQGNDDYGNYEQQDYYEKKKKDEPVDVVVKIEAPDCCCRKHEKQDKCDKKDKHDKYEKNEKFCCPIDVALNAATGGAGPLPIIAIGDLTQVIPVVSVTIDADCICDPDVLLTFTTTITLPVAVVATLGFAVIRTSTCCGTPITIGPGFTYATTVVALESDSFTFQLFDADLEPGTYTYTVVLTPSTVTTVAGVALVNATLSALAVSDVG